MPDYRPNASASDLDYNPYVTRYETLTLQAASAADEVGRRSGLLNWYKSFDGRRAFADLNSDLREIGRLELELEQIPSEMARHLARLEGLRDAASLGRDPRYWFSSARSIKKRELREQQKIVRQINDKLATVRQRLNTMQERVSKQKIDLDRHRRFDVLGEEAAEKELSRQLLQLKSEMAQIQTLTEEFDHQLMVPRKVLRDLCSRENALEYELRNAEGLESRLSAATNSYERKQIHASCSNMFGESRPSRVINDKRRKLESLNRDIGKAKERLKLETRRASLSAKIKTLVIDGSNLCYDGSIFIGLSALRVIARELSSKFVLIIVFDASIRRKIGMDDQEIASNFGNGIKVHVMASKQRADEMLLDTATPADAWVISNDRFGEFPDKPAIHEERVIRHEILIDKVNIYELNFTGAF
jgi:hypothetical protein